MHSTVNTTSVNRRCADQVAKVHWISSRLTNWPLRLLFLSIVLLSLLDDPNRGSTIIEWLLVYAIKILRIETLNCRKQTAIATTVQQTSRKQIAMMLPARPQAEAASDRRRPQ